MKWIDLPPVWLCLCVAMAWVSPVTFVPGAWAGLGWIALAGGGILTAAAVMAFQKARTTIIPRQAPAALITGGIFQQTRNPIYLADVLFLTGLSLIWGSVVGLVLVPIFAIFLQSRFILGEEAKLREAFGETYEAYAIRVRRWI